MAPAPADLDDATLTSLHTKTWKLPDRCKPSTSLLFKFVKRMQMLSADALVKSDLTPGSGCCLSQLKPNRDSLTASCSIPPLLPIQALLPSVLMSDGEGSARTQM